MMHQVISPICSLFEFQDDFFISTVNTELKTFGWFLLNSLLKHLIFCDFQCRIKTALQKNKNELNQKQFKDKALKKQKFFLGPVLSEIRDILDIKTVSVTSSWHCGILTFILPFCLITDCRVSELGTSSMKPHLIYLLLSFLTVLLLELSMRLVAITRYGTSLKSR